jgi:AraC-like DNA-binding protein
MDLSVPLLRNYGVTNGVAADHGYGLPIHKLRRATEFIEENLREDLTLTRISEALAMSPQHLAPAFKTTTRPPDLRPSLCRRVAHRAPASVFGTGRRRPSEMIRYK